MVDDKFTTAVVLNKGSHTIEPVLGLLISPTPMSGTEWEKLLAEIQDAFDAYEYSEEAADDDFPFDTILCRLVPDFRYEPCVGTLLA